MKLLNLNELTPEHFKAFSQPPSGELTPEERAEVMRLATAGLSVEELDRPESWEPAAPMEELLRELRDEQQRRDEQHP